MHEKRHNARVNAENREMSFSPAVPIVTEKKEEERGGKGRKEEKRGVLNFSARIAPFFGT